MDPSSVTIRTLARIDRMDPQYAAYWGLMAQGALPLAGMTQLILEVAPSNAIFKLTDLVMKAVDVRSAGTLIERDFGLLELHASMPDPIVEAEAAILAALGRNRQDRLAPEIVSLQRITGLTDYHSQLLNKVRRGTWTLPQESVTIVEVTPAGYAYPLADAVLKGVDIALIRCAGTGLFGRLIIAGSEAAAERAEMLARAAAERIRAEATTQVLAGG